MENLYKNIINWVKTFFSILKILFRSQWLTERLKKGSNNCIIIGNGPSANEALELLATSTYGMDLICLNKFPVTKYYDILKPNFFAIVSREYWKQGTILKYNKIRDDIIQAYINKTKWPSTILIPFEAKKNKKFICKFLKNKNIKICYYNTTPLEGETCVNNILLSLRLGSPRPHNVMIPCILNAIWANYKNVYLIGADHSWLETLKVNLNNEALLNQKHFYDIGESNHSKMTKSGNEYRKLHEILEKFMLTFKAYLELNRFANKKGVNIINCTINSYIDAFPKSPLEIILKAKNNNK